MDTDEQELEIDKGMVEQAERLNKERMDRYKRLRSTNDPVEAFNIFIDLNVDPSLHAHFADSDDNEAEFVRRAIEADRHHHIALAQKTALENLNWAELTWRDVMGDFILYSSDLHKLVNEAIASIEKSMEGGEDKT